MQSNLFYGWWVVLACSLINLYVSGVSFFGFTAFFEPIHQTFGWSHTQISFAVSLQGLEMGIFAPLVGILVDRVGPRRMIQWGVLVVGAGLLLLSATSSLLMFYMAFLLVSFGAGGCTAVVTNTTVANWFHKKIGLAMGLMASGVGAGGLMVMLIVALIDRFQWRMTLVILGIGTFLLGFPLAAMVRDRPEAMGLLPDGRPELPVGPGAALSAPEVAFSIGQVIKNRSFIFLNLVEIIRLMAIPAVVVHVMPYLSGIGVSRARAGMVAAAIPLMSIIGRLGFGWLGDRFDKAYVMAASFALMSVGILSFGFAAVPWLIPVFLICFPLGHGGGMVMRSTIIREYFGRKAYGKIIGIVMGAGAIGGIIGPTGAGWIHDTTGSYHMVWMLLSALTALSIGLVLRLK